MTTPAAVARNDVFCSEDKNCLIKGVQDTPKPEDIHVTSANSGGLVYGARRKGSNIELITRDLTTSCTGEWTTVGSVDGNGVDSFRPVMFGHVRGLIVQRGGQLQVVYP